MALKKKELKEVAENNTTVTKGTKSNQQVVKQGVPNEHSVKHLSQAGIVGASLGITKNMDNYESLRIDVWLTDNVGDKETQKDAFERVVGVLDEVLSDTVQSYIEE